MKLLSLDGAHIGHAIQHTIHADQTTDFDAASVGSGNSNLSAGALQVKRTVYLFFFLQYFKTHNRNYNTDLTLRYEHGVIRSVKTISEIYISKPYLCSIGFLFFDINEPIF